MADKHIQTYIFFDVETTGIPAKKAKITELSFVAVLRSDLERRNNTKSLPPISKLCILFNPQKDIQPAAEKITGLNRDFLKNQPVFGDTIECINAFLDKPKPVCLVAHNGNTYDFKIIKQEYLEANRNLPDDLLCVDSLSVFKEILKPNISKKPVKEKSEISRQGSDRSVQDDDSWQDMSKEEIDEIEDLLNNISLSTSTPKASSTLNKVKKENIKNDNEKISYKLSCLYERLLNKKATNAHHAEADCIMLLECVVATKQIFLSCADKKQKLLSEIKI